MPPLRCYMNTCTYRNTYMYFFLYLFIYLFIYVCVHTHSCSNPKPNFSLSLSLSPSLSLALSCSLPLSTCVCVCIYTCIHSFARPSPAKSCLRPTLGLPDNYSNPRLGALVWQRWADCKSCSSSSSATETSATQRNNGLRPELPAQKAKGRMPGYPTRTIRDYWVTLLSVSVCFLSYQELEPTWRPNALVIYLVTVCLSLCCPIYNWLISTVTE